MSNGLPTTANRRESISHDAVQKPAKKDPRAGQHTRALIELGGTRLKGNSTELSGEFQVAVAKVLAALSVVNIGNLEDFKAESS